MTKKLRVSMVQMQVTDVVDTNVDTAVKLIKKAAEDKPDVIVLPENFHYFGTKEQFFEIAETIDGPTITKLRSLAKELNTYIVSGTMKLRVDGDSKLRNICCVINQSGEIQDIYDKIHTFNAQVGGIRHSGSEVENSGDKIVVTDIKGVKVGLSVCFDMRFPEIYRIMALQGAEVILVPSIFMLHTGMDHWEVLLRARAIENQLYIVAPATHGTFPPKGQWSYGRSMAIDPWGLVVAQASDIDCVVTVNLDFNLLKDIRNRVPTLPQRKPSVYKWNEVD